MSRLIKLVGGAVGLAAEAHQRHKENKEISRSQQASPSPSAGPSNPPRPRDALSTTPSSSSQQAYLSADSCSDPPPVYVEVPNEEADRLIMSGKAVPADDDECDESHYVDEEVEYDEEDWELDEAVSPLNEEPEELQDEKTTNFETLVRDTCASIGPPPTTITPMHCPVIIPPRRPGSKGRGFVRAYAPILADSGIDQETFLRFLKNFHKASQASPVFTAVMVAAGIAGMAPSVIAMAVTTIVQVGAKVGQEVQSRQRTNNFLDRMNQELFMPRGLYALIFKYKSISSSANEAPITAERIDINTAKIISKYLPGTDNGNGTTGSTDWSSKFQNLRLASGTSTGETQMPACAPLIFPSLDATLDATTPDNAETRTLKAKAKRGHKFLADYMDKRAQATYAAQNPDSTLARAISEGEGEGEAKKGFRSKLADPNHPAFQGGILQLVRGGKVRDGEGWGGLLGGSGATGAVLGRGSGYGQDQYGREENDGGYDDQGQDQYSRRHDRQDQRRDQRHDRRDLRHDRRLGRKDIGRFGGLAGLVGQGHEYLANRQADQSGYSNDLYGNQSAPPASYGRSSGQAGYRGSSTPAPYSQFSAPAPYGQSSNPAPAAYGSSPRPAPVPYGSSNSSNSIGGRNRGRGNGSQRQDGPIAMVKRALKEDVVYLMIVNMPSAEEMEEARRIMLGA